MHTPGLHVCIDYVALFRFAGWTARGGCAKTSPGAPGFLYNFVASDEN